MLEAITMILSVVNYDDEKGGFYSPFLNIFETDKHKLSNNEFDLLDELSSKDLTGVNLDDILKNWDDIDGSVVDYIKNIQTGNIELKEGESLVDGYTRTATSGFSKVGNAIKSIGVGLINSAIMALVSFIATKAIEAIDDYVHRVEIAKDTIKEAIDESENTKSEIESINSELETTNNQINELKSKGTLTLTEQSELDNLIEQNRLLEETLRLKEKEAEIDLNNSIRTITQQYDTASSGYSDEIITDTLGSTEFKDLDEYEKRIKEGQLELQRYRNDMKQAGEDERASLEVTVNTMSENIQAELENLDKYKKKYAEWLIELEGYKNQMDQKGYENLEPIEQDYYNRILNDIDKARQIVYDENEYIDIKIRASVDDSSVADSISQIYNTLNNNQLFQNLSQGERENVLNSLFELEPDQIDYVLKNIDSIFNNISNRTSRNYSTWVNNIKALAAKGKQEIAEATNTIGLPDVNVTQPLNELKEAFSGFGDIISEFNSGTTVSADSVEGLMKNLEDAEAKMPGAKNALNEFRKVVTEMPDDIDAQHDALNELATFYIDHGTLLDNLTDSNAEYVKSELEKIGVINADEVVESRLALTQVDIQKAQENLTTIINNCTDAKVKARLAGINLANMTNEEAAMLANEAVQAGITTGSLFNLAAQKLNVNNLAIATAGDCNQLANLITWSEAASSALRNLANAKAALSNSGKGGAATALHEQTKGTKKIVDNALKGNTAKVEIGKTSGNTSGGSGGGGGGGSKSSKDTKQLVDWIERRINVLTTKAERWANIIEKATDDKKIDSYYKKLDSYTQKQIKTYGDAYNRYMSKANSVKLSSGLKNKVQSKDNSLFDKNGNLKSYKKLVKEYGQKNADKISKYQEYYDKAISAIDEFTESSYKLANSPLEKAADKIDLLSKSMDVLDSKLKTYTVNDYASANKTIDAQMTNSAQQNDANRQALITAASKVNAVKNTSYEDLIKNGKKLEEIDVSSLKLGSKKYKNAVKQNAYIKAYNEALEVAQKSENELIKQNIEYRKQQFDNVQNYYDKQLELKQAEYDIEEGEIKLLEARGAFVQASHYKAESDIERDKLKILNDENAALTQQLKLLESTENGKYSEEWYECSKAIRDVNEAINDAKVNLANLNDKMNTTVKTLMNYTIGVGERATNEINFVIDLMGEVENFDMNHIVTNEGITRLGSYVANMRIASEEAGTLHDAVLAIQTAIEKGESKVNLGIFGNLDYSEEVDSAKRMTETYEEFLDKWQDKIKETYDYRVKMHEFVKNMLQEEMSALNELISDYKDALNDTKNLKDYQKNVREQTDNIGSLRKQMSGVSGDTSEEGINRYLQLQKELSDAEKQLEETELDHMLNEQQAMLDKLSEEYQSTITALSADTNYLDEVANGILSSNNKLLDDIYNEYVKDYRYAEQFKNAMTVALNSEDGILTDIKDALTGNESPIIKAITDSSTNIVNAVNNDNANNSNNQSAPTPTPDVDSGSSNTSSASTGDEVVGQVQLLRPLDEWDMMKADVEAVFADSKYYAKGKKKKASDYKTPINQFLFSKNGKVLSDDGLKQLRKILKTDNNNILNVLKDLSQMKGNIKNVGGFAHGGIGKLVKPTGEDGLTWVRNEEGFVAPEDVKHIQDLLTITPQITKAFETSTLPTPLANNSIGDIEFNIEMNGVNDVETFSQQIREAYCSDARIRKMIQADNIGQISGNATKTTRNRYR